MQIQSNLRLKELISIVFTCRVELSKKSFPTLTNNQKSILIALSNNKQEKMKMVVSTEKKRK